MNQFLEKEEKKKSFERIGEDTYKVH